MVKKITAQRSTQFIAATARFHRIFLSANITTISTTTTTTLSTKIHVGDLAKRKQLPQHSICFGWSTNAFDNPDSVNLVMGITTYDVSRKSLPTKGTIDRWHRCLNRKIRQGRIQEEGATGLNYSQNCLNI